MSNKPVSPVDAATVLIIRDGDAHPRYGTLQILMVKRHAKIRFAGGAYVFPGGKLNAADRAQELGLISPEVNGALKSELLGFRTAAMREVFEETGLILGTRGGKPLGEAERQVIERQFRTAFLEKTMTIGEFTAQSLVELDMSRYLPFAHWITPIDYPMRFNTRFFLCVAPEGQCPSPDGHEITEMDWMHPMALVEESDGDLMFPTMMNLKKLGRSKSVAEALEVASKDKIVTVMPEVIVVNKIKSRKIPEDAGYDDVDQSRTRLAIDID